MVPIWIVFMKDTPDQFLSAHSTKEKAQEAIIKYTKSAYWGGEETDYVIKGQFLDFVID